MKQVRFGAFETNSSSAHCLTLMTKEDYARWEDDVIRYDHWEDIFVDRSNEEFECGTTFAEANDAYDFCTKTIALGNIEAIAVAFTVEI